MFKNVKYHAYVFQNVSLIQTKRFILSAKCNQILIVEIIHHGNIWRTMEASLSSCENITKIKQEKNNYFEMSRISDGYSVNIVPVHHSFVNKQIQ